MSGFICVEGTCLTSAPPLQDTGVPPESGSDEGVFSCTGPTAAVCDGVYLRACVASNDERIALCPNNNCSNGQCSSARSVQHNDAVAFARAAMRFPAPSDGLTYYLINTDTGAISGFRNETELSQPNTLRAAGAGYNTVGGIRDIYFAAVDSQRSYLVVRSLNVPQGVRVQMVGVRAMSLLVEGAVEVEGELRADGGYSESGMASRREPGPGGGSGGVGGDTTAQADGAGAGGGRASRARDAGGGGGSFASRGGRGGYLEPVDVSSGALVALDDALNSWRAGSGGAAGGSGASDIAGGDGGGGGGLLHIFSRAIIRVDGLLSASGAGGGGGRSAANAADASAGGGGGSGGLIVLEAPIVAGAGRLRVLGGAGGQGGRAGTENGASGANGGDNGVRAVGARWPAPADVRGGGGSGCDASGVAEDGQNGIADGEKGGGGGGGSGRIAVRLVGDPTVRLPGTEPNPAVCRNLSDLLGN